MANTVDNTYVYDLTSITVDSEQIAVAIGILESYAGRELSLAKLSDADTFWFKRAIAYEAAWITAQADLFERVDLTSLSYDEMNITPRDEVSFVIAPMAKMAMANCSWSNVPSAKSRAGSVSTASYGGRAYYDIYTKTDRIV